MVYGQILSYNTRRTVRNPIGRKRSHSFRKPVKRPSRRCASPPGDPIQRRDSPSTMALRQRSLEREVVCRRAPRPNRHPHGNRRLRRSRLLRHPLSLRRPSCRPVDSVPSTAPAPSPATETYGAKRASARRYRPTKASGTGPRERSRLSSRSHVLTRMAVALPLSMMRRMKSS